MHCASKKFIVRSILRLLQLKILFVEVLFGERRGTTFEALHMKVLGQLSSCHDLEERLGFPNVTFLCETSNVLNRYLKLSVWTLAIRIK
jgi:hypothetical protein